MEELKETLNGINANLKELTAIFKQRSEELDRREAFLKELDKEIEELKRSRNAL